MKVKYNFYFFLMKFSFWEGMWCRFGVMCLWSQALLGFRMSVRTRLVTIKFEEVVVVIRIFLAKIWSCYAWNKSFFEYLTQFQIFDFQFSGFESWHLSSSTTGLPYISSSQTKVSFTSTQQNLIRICKLNTFYMLHLFF